MDATVSANPGKPSATTRRTRAKPPRQRIFEGLLDRLDHEAS
jgi:hypothetical protein